MNKIVFFIIIASHFGVSAQVTKCVDPKTKAVSYTDAACPTQNTGTSVAILKHELPLQNNGAKNTLIAAPRQTLQPAAEQGGVNNGDGSGREIESWQTRIDRKNAETGASSITSKKNHATVKAPVTPPTPERTLTYCANDWCHFNIGPSQFMPRR